MLIMASRDSVCLCLVIEIYNLRAVKGMLILHIQLLNLANV